MTNNPSATRVSRNGTMSGPEDERNEREELVNLLRSISVTTERLATREEELSKMRNEAALYRSLYEAERRKQVDSGPSQTNGQPLTETLHGQRQDPPPLFVNDKTSLASLCSLPSTLARLPTGDSESSPSDASPSSRCSSLSSLPAISVPPPGDAPAILSVKSTASAEAMSDPVSITMDDDGTAGIGVAAAAALAVASARAWAGFARESASLVQRTMSLPGRSPYRLVAGVNNVPSGWPGEKTEGEGLPQSSLPPIQTGTRLGGLGGAGVVRGESPPLSSSPPLSDPSCLPPHPSSLLRPSRPQGAQLKLQWLHPPKTVLVITKQTCDVLQYTLRVVDWLRNRGLCVFVEPKTYHEVIAQRCLTNWEPGAQPTVLQDTSAVSTFYSDLVAHTKHEMPDAFFTTADGPACVKKGRLLTWAEDGSQRTLHEIIDHLDLVVTLGGDGTVLYTCNLFDNRPVPPLVAFALGSLGFVTHFCIEDMEEVLSQALRGGFPLMIRHRLHCRIMRKGPEEEPHPKSEVVTEDHVVLNEMVIDRGMSPFLTRLDCYVDDTFLTVVQGDGLIIATPTGSTAYSLSAGGCMVHPSVPAILLTAIAPHTLSFRPMVLPDHVRLTVKVPEDARGTTWCSFDGKERQQLSAGDAVFIRVSRWPVPVVSKLDATHDFFMSLREGLHWNERQIQGERESKSSFLSPVAAATDRADPKLG